MRKQLRKGLFVAFNHTLNPVTRRIARSSFGPFALVRHVGRHTGKKYETPIIVSRVPDAFVIELTYGYDVDWHKNVLAAGGCQIVWHGEEYAIDRVEPLDSATGRAAFPLLARLILRLLGRTHFEKFRVQPVTSN